MDIAIACRGIKAREQLRTSCPLPGATPHALHSTSVSAQRLGRRCGDQGDGKQTTLNHDHHQRHHGVHTMPCRAG
eukprot:3804861-Pyramimonas_sp.AAC.1